jgi:hypothetical protein
LYIKDKKSISHIYERFQNSGFAVTDVEEWITEYEESKNEYVLSDKEIDQRIKEMKFDKLQEDSIRQKILIKKQQKLEAREQKNFEKQQEKEKKKLEKQQEKEMILETAIKEQQEIEEQERLEFQNVWVQNKENKDNEKNKNQNDETEIKNELTKKRRRISDPAIQIRNEAICKDKYENNLTLKELSLKYKCTVNLIKVVLCRNKNKIIVDK